MGAMMTDQQKEHLKALSKLLRMVDPDRFSMDTYGYREESGRRICADPIDATCNTVACAAGHGPMLAAEYSETKGRPHEIWTAYIVRVFGVTDESYEWLFSDEWEHFDNTPAGAADRIDHYLEHGVPLGFESPLDYAEPGND